MTQDESLERRIDRAVWRRLATDRAYQHAENAEQQAEREEAITLEVEAELAPDVPLTTV